MKLAISILAAALHAIPAESDAAGGHWSLQPLKGSAEWGVWSAEWKKGGANPIDRCMDALAAKDGRQRAPEADSRTLIRRATYDLTGLPPTPEEVEAFAAEKRRTPHSAFRTLISRLLASPRYGEHWARHWLDVAQYADTHGNDHDHARPNAWPWRDYVIRSLNDDKPYARFVQEQVAGDALFPDDPQATVALGFLAAGPWDDTLMVTVREDTVDHRMAQVLDRDGMVSAVMNTFQSLTVHCARCHDHKFDPISQREYYSLQAVFAGVDRADRPFDADAATNVRRRELLAKKNAIERRDAAVLASLDSPGAVQKVTAAVEALANRSRVWQPLDVISVTNANGVETSFARQADGSWLAGGAPPEKDTFIITAQTKEKDIRALRLEALPDDSLPGRGPGRYAPTGNFHLTEFRAFAQPATGETKGAVKLEFSRALADHSDTNDVIAGALDGRMETFWSVHPRYGEAHEAVFELKEPAGYEAGTTLIIRLEQNGTTRHQLGRFRLSYCTGALPVSLRAPVPAKLADLLRKPLVEHTPEQQRELALQILTAEVDADLAALPAPQFVYAATRDFKPQGSFKPSPAPRPVHLLKRGDINQPAELVSPGALQCLAPEFTLADAGDESARRAALARWLTDSRNVLTWRSIVNRVWHYHFGRGLCDTPNDFGKMGSKPAHPELLDSLALWFRDEAKGSLKELHRLIMTSAEWTQGGRRTRLTGEQVRDTMLQMSGQLDLKMGGPPAVQFVHRDKATFNPDGGAPAFLDYDNYSPDDPANRRRAVYRFIFRTVPDPLMEALDCPDGGAAVPVRNQSTTALQAFALLNDAFLIRQCEHIAARISKNAATPEAQVAIAFRLMLQRPPKADELEGFAAYVWEHGLANACHVLLNSNEFVFLD